MLCILNVVLDGSARVKTSQDGIGPDRFGLVNRTELLFCRHFLVLCVGSH